MIEVRQAVDLELVRVLFREYQVGVNAPECFASFDTELASLPAPYFAILIAWVDDAEAGCVAVKALGEGVAEMKRLYVRPGYRGLGLGERLVRAVVDASRGFERLRLDTLPSMGSAIGLYRRLGFVEIGRYNDNPDAGALFFEILISN